MMYKVPGSRDGSFRPYERSAVNEMVVHLEAEASGSAQSSDVPFVDDFDLRFGDEEGPHFFGVFAVGVLYR